MQRRTMVFSAAAGVALLAGCASSHSMTMRVPDDPWPIPINGGLVFTRAQLWNRGGTLLNTLADRVTDMIVTESNTCPSITIRGHTSIQGSSNPRIYIDGLRAANTCVLDELDVTDLNRVEVYPQGVVNRPGYLNDPNGLILVFMRGSDE